MEKFDVTIYCDGSCSRNGSENATGGWSAIISFAGREKVVTGFESNTTNQRMELRALIEGVRVLKKPCNITAFTDSQYVIVGTQNLREWRARGWKTASGSSPRNKDLWDELVSVGLAGGHKITMKKVQGHAGDQMNERADKLAKEASKHA